MEIETIRFIEELAANAWPAETIQIVDGWRLRANHGVTRRTNSVWPNEDTGKTPTEDKLNLVEAFYQRRKLTPRFQICPACQPPELDTILVNRGYDLEALTAVQTADIAKVLFIEETPFSVSIFEELGDIWFETYAKSEGLSEHSANIRHKTFRRIGPQQAYALVEMDGRPVAVGQGVYERGWVGIFDMSTHPDYRRRGCATAILRALASWGRPMGGTRMYLQVMENNLPAKALYESAGFAPIYHYHYRSLGSPGTH